MVNGEWGEVGDLGDLDDQIFVGFVLIIWDGAGGKSVNSINSISKNGSFVLIELRVGWGNRGVDVDSFRIVGEYGVWVSGNQAGCGPTINVTGTCLLICLQPVTLRVTLRVVIKNFKHKGLEKFFLAGSKAGIDAAHSSKLRLILGRLNASAEPQDLNLPGLFLHELRGNRVGTWSVRVSGNWRVTFEFDGQYMINVDYEDNH